MSRLIFWDVDTQADFMTPEGALYVPRSEQIIPRLAALTRFAHDRRIRIVASAEEHDPGDDELSATPDFAVTWPPHCLRGTPGQARIPETALRDPLVVPPEPQDPERLAERVRPHQGDVLLLKRRFDVFSNANTGTVLAALDPSVVVLYGVALDICGRYAVEGLLLHRPHARLYVVMDAMKAIRYEVGEHLLKEWGDEGVRLVKAAEVLEDGVLDPYL